MFAITFSQSGDINFGGCSMLCNITTYILTKSMDHKITFIGNVKYLRGIAQLCIFYAFCHGY